MNNVIKERRDALVKQLIERLDREGDIRPYFERISQPDLAKLVSYEFELDKDFKNDVFQDILSCEKFDTYLNQCLRAEPIHQDLYSDAFGGQMRSLILKSPAIKHRIEQRLKTSNWCKDFFNLIFKFREV